MPGQINNTESIKMGLTLERDRTFIMAEGLQTRNRSRHIDIQYHYSRELIQKKEIKLIKVSGEENMADIFTKPNIKAETYRKHVARIFGHAQ